MHASAANDDEPPQPDQPGAYRGWYVDPGNPNSMLFWTGDRWKDAEKVGTAKQEGWLVHSLLFLVVTAAIGAAMLLFLAGILILPFALRTTGRRARDTFTLVIPIWNVVLLTETFWRLSAQRMCWLPRTDMPSRPLFGPGVLPIDIIPPNAQLDGLR